MWNVAYSTVAYLVDRKFGPLGLQETLGEQLMTRGPVYVIVLSKKCSHEHLYRIQTELIQFLGSKNMEVSPSDIYVPSTRVLAQRQLDTLCPFGPVMVVVDQVHI
jgi:hypothetical protein